MRYFVSIFALVFTCVGFPIFAQEETTEQTASHSTEAPVSGDNTACSENSADTAKTAE